MICGAIRAQGGKLFGDERAHADILQADGVEHSGRRLAQARRRRARHGFEGQPFDDDAAEPVQIGEVGKLDAVAKGAAGGDNGIGKAHRADIRRRDPLRPDAAHGGVV